MTSWTYLFGQFCGSARLLRAVDRIPLKRGKRDPFLLAVDGAAEGWNLHENRLRPRFD